MPSVLRKKIEAGAGLPPTILRNVAFWEALYSGVSDWAGDSMDGAVVPAPEVRRVLAGDEAREFLENRTTFFFNAAISPGLCAVAADTAGAARSAARRLGQDFETARQSTPLFLRLMFEAPAIALWRRLAEDLEGHDPAIQSPPMVEAHQAAGMFDPAARYLLVAYGVMPDATRSQVWAVFHLDYVLRQTVLAEQRAADSKRRNASPALHASVMTSPIRLDAVLDRITMTIAECSRLNVGDVILLPDTDPRFVSLSADTVNGSINIGQCELGVWKRQRALKLKQPMLEPFTQEVAKM